MPGPRVPKHFARAGPIKLDLDERPFRVGHSSRGVPRNIHDVPSQNQPEQQRQSSPSYADSYAPLFDNDTHMSGDDNDNEEEEEEEEDDDQDDEGAIDQDAMLRARLADLMIDSRDYDALPAGFDEDQLRLDLEYAERDIDQLDGPDNVPFDEEFVDEDVIDAWVAEQDAVTAIPTPAEGRITDASTLIHHHCDQHADLSTFELALGLHAHTSRMSREQYTTLLQILGTLRGQDGKPITAIQRLPRQVRTLKGRIEKRLPLLDMRVTQIPLQAAKLKTDSASRKREEAKQRQQQQEAMGSESATVTEEPDDPDTILAPLYFMDPKSLFEAFLNSDAAAKMHKGMAHLVDNPTELHHALCWSSSVRTTSGEYAHFVGGNNSGDTGKAIFPSDFIYFRCLDDVAGFDCPCRLPPEHADHMLHIGRVKAIGENHTSDFVDYAGEVTLVVQECLTIEDIDDEFPGVGFGAQVNEDMDFKTYELVLRLEQEHWIPQYFADSFAPVQVDYFDGDTLNDPSPPVDTSQKKKKQKPRKLFRKYSTIPENPRKKGHYLVRRALQKTRVLNGASADREVGPTTNNNNNNNNRRDDIPGIPDRKIIPLALTPRLRAQLEIETYGREIFEQYWDRVNNPGLDVLSCPVITFIDGFGVYRNARRSVIGMYQSPASLPLGNRSRNANIFPIVLGPHASNFEAVVNAMGCLMPLDQGIMMDIKGRPTVVSVFTMCYTGDMPQQDKNSGVVGTAGLKFCRFCFIGPDHVINKQDVVEDWTPDINRFHHQHLQMRHELENNIRKKGDKKAYQTQWGISKIRPALFDLTPGLDTILTRPPDPAHSEFKGMAAHVHEMLMDAFLTPQSRLEYCRILQKWPFPPGWSSIPSPKYYLKSYELSSHGKWSIIAPLLFEAWLEKDHFDLYVWEAWKELVGKKHSNPSDEYCVKAICNALAAMARSTSMLMSTRNTQDQYEQLDNTVLIGRQWYVTMCQAAAEGTARNPRANEAFKTKARPTGLPSEASSRRSSIAQSQQSRAASVIHIDDDDDENMDMAIDDGDDVAPVAEAAAKATGLPKRANEYIRKALRPNVHIGIHYDDIYEEYGPPALLNVLAEEKYHKRLKKTAETTNGRDVEKFILQHERIVHTIRFVMLNAFALSDPTLTRQIHDLTKQTPSIFEKLLHREEQIRIGLMDGNGNGNGDGDNDEFDIDHSADDTHLRPAVSGKFKVDIMRKTRHPIAAGINRDTGQPYCLPLTSKQMPDVFRRALTQAYDIDYGIPYMVFGPGVIQYSSRVSFSDETFKRYTFNLGDHVRYRNVDGFGRIDHIFVHEQARMNERRIFLVLTRVVPTPTAQTVTYLQVPIIEDTHESIIVGLPALKTDRVYIVDVSKLRDRQKRGHQPIWAWVNWDIILM